MAARMAEHGGDLSTARMMWSATYENTHDALIRANAAAHLRAIQAEDEITFLDHLVEVYRQRTGKNPASFSDMISAGLLAGIPVDPWKRPYRLQSGSVIVTDPDDLPFLEKGLPPGYHASPVPKLYPAN